MPPKIPRQRLLPKVKLPVPGPQSRRWSQKLRQYECPNITYVADDFPLVWREAKGCLVKDVDRNWYLDLSASFGVVVLGHNNPRVVRTLKRQAERLIHGMGDLHPSLAKIHAARELVKRVPVADGQVIFGSSGSEAVEAALKTALLYTGKPRVIAFTGAYHGLTYGALHATGWEMFKAPFRSQMSDFVTHLPYGTPEGWEESLNRLEDHLKGDSRVGAVLLEPVQGRGGVIVPPEAWIRGVRELCTRYRVLMIADEILTGMGRTGRWFACDCADLYCVGKALAGGLPLSACVASAEVMRAWGESQGEALHTSTFLGNPLACTVALTVFNEIERLHLLSYVQQIGAWFGEQLFQRLKRFPGVGAIRGIGLMWGIELVKPDGSPDPETTRRVVIAALQKGLILLPAGTGNVIEFTPPYLIQQLQLEYALQALEEIFSASVP